MMDDSRILITYGENWEGNTYNDGLSWMLFVPSNLTYEVLLVLVHGIVRAYPDSYVYDIRSLLNTHSKIIRFKIQNDNDSHYVLRVRNGDFEVYVTIEHHSQQFVNQSVNT